MILRLAITAYLVGLLVFYTRATFDIPMWAWTYWIWEKGCSHSVLSIYIIYKLSHEKRLIAPVLAFTFIRFLWEIVSAFTGIYSNNQWVVAGLFMVLVVVIGYLCFRKESKLTNFLVKHIP